MQEIGEVSTLEQQAQNAAPPIVTTPPSFNRTRRESRTPALPVWASAILFLTATVSILLSHYLFLDGDDLLELWCDRVSSLSQLIHIQSTLPLVMGFIYLTPA